MQRVQRICARLVSLLIYWHFSFNSSPSVLCISVLCYYALFLRPPLYHLLMEGDDVWAVRSLSSLPPCQSASYFLIWYSREPIEGSLRFKCQGRCFFFSLRDSWFLLGSLMWCVTEMGKISRLCFPQISKCLISRCVALIHNARAEYGSVACPEARLLSPHILYLTGLLFSLHHSTPLHGPNSALTVAAVWLGPRVTLTLPFPSCAVSLIRSALYCGAVEVFRGLQDHWEHRLFALRPEREELVSLALSAAWRVWGEKALPKAKSSQWTVNRIKSLKLRFFFFFVSFLLAKFVWGATGWETIWLFSKIKNIILLKLIFGHAKHCLTRAGLKGSEYFDRIRSIYNLHVIFGCSELVT